MAFIAERHHWKHQNNSLSTIKKAEGRSDVLRSAGVLNVDFEQVNAGWEGLQVAREYS